MSKIYTVIGNRPQFMKIDKELHQRVIHTGQHFDREMSGRFFKELDLPKPYKNLGIHSEESGRMFDELLRIFKKDKPGLVLVYGDTVSTLMGALAAKYENIPVAHIEAGCRSGNFNMPEEVNRIVVDKISDVRFCFTATNYKNLVAEGLQQHSFLLRGDPMFDAMNQFLPIKKIKNYQKYILITIHRNFNADSKERMNAIFSALKKSKEKFIFPIHPRTKKMIGDVPKNVELIEPVGYKEMLKLESNSKKIITDSGGVQREAYWMRIPCIVLRKETEWTETVESGWAKLVDADSLLISDAVVNFKPDFRVRQKELPIFGVNKKIREILPRYIK